MKVVLDECLPKRLRREPPGHDVSIVQELGWSGIKDGESLDLVEHQFDVFITVDGNPRYQQNLASRQVAIIVLSAVDNKYSTLAPLVPKVLTAISASEIGSVTRVATIQYP